MLIKCQFEYDLILMYTNAIINYMYFLYRHASIKPIHFLILFFNVRSIQYDFAINIYFPIFVQGVI